MSDNVLQNLERYVKELLHQPVSAQLEQRARQFEQQARQLSSSCDGGFSVWPLPVLPHS